MHKMCFGRLSRQQDGHVAKCHVEFLCHTLMTSLHLFSNPPTTALFRWFKFTLKPPYSIAHDKLRLAIRDTSFWTFWLKFGHKGP